MSTIALARTTFGASTARVPAWIVETATYRAPEGADVDGEIACLRRALAP